MVAGKPFRDRYAIVGVGITKMGRVPEYSARTLQAEAVRLAIEDAGLRREDIDGAINGRSAGGSEPNDGGWTDAFPRILGLPVNFYWTMGRGGTAAFMGIVSAIGALEACLAKYVVVARGDDGWSRTHGVRRMLTARRGYGDLGVSEVVGFSAGASAATSHAFFASRYMHEYGATSRDFGAAAVSNQEWACLNPEAMMYGRPITIEDHQNSRMVIAPYRLFDCCLQSDGGIAFIITTAERARDLRKPPAHIMGLGFGEHIRKLWWEKGHLTQLDVEPAKEAAFGQAGIELSDIDVAEFYDCFTGEVLLQLEDYGWCNKGEAGAFIAEGNTRPGGTIPTNTWGGLLSGYYLFDYPGIAEGIVQLRGEAGARQVPGAEIALATGHGGEIVFPGMCSTHSCIILGR